MADSVTIEAVPRMGSKIKPRRGKPGAEILQQELENKLKLPVVVTKSGTVFVLDAFGQNAGIFTSHTDSPIADLPTRRGKASRPRQNVPFRLILRYPEVSLKAAQAGLDRFGSVLNRAQSVHIIIDTGALAPNWPCLERFTAALISNMQSKKIPAGLTIDGVFARPDSRCVDWLAGHRIGTRCVLGPSLGYAGGIDDKTAKTLKAMSDDGLRVPVLFYWSGESAPAVRDLLRKALQLNRFAGAGIQPCLLSPRFDFATMHDNYNQETFSRVVGSLYADRLLCEYLEEPIGDIERRLAGSAGAKHVSGLITEDGELLSFRCFPFAAGRGPNGKLQLNVPMRRQCVGCAWRHICGGIDAAPPAFRRQYTIAADAWCGYHKALMRRVVKECLEIREHLHQIKESLPREGKV